MMALAGFCFAASYRVNPLELRNAMKIKDRFAVFTLKDFSKETSEKILSDKQEVLFFQQEIDEIINKYKNLKYFFGEQTLSCDENESEEDLRSKEDGQLGKRIRLEGRVFDRKEEISEKKDPQNKDFLKLKTIQHVLLFIKNNTVDKDLEKKINSIIEMGLEGTIQEIKNKHNEEYALLDLSRDLEILILENKSRISLLNGVGIELKNPCGEKLLKLFDAQYETPLIDTVSQEIKQNKKCISNLLKKIKLEWIKVIWNDFK